MKGMPHLPPQSKTDRWGWQRHEEEQHQEQEEEQQQQEEEGEGAGRTRKPGAGASTRSRQSMAHLRTPAEPQSAAASSGCKASDMRPWHSQPPQFPGGASVVMSRSMTR